MCRPVRKIIPHLPAWPVGKNHLSLVGPARWKKSPLMFRPGPTHGLSGVWASGKAWARTDLYSKCLKLIEAYRWCGLSFRDISSRTGRHPSTTMLIWNQWIAEGHTEKHEESQRSPITNARKGQTYCEVTPAKSYNHIRGHKSGNEYVEACSTYNILSSALMVCQCL